MTEINFFWDPVEDNIVQERDETGAVVADYTTEPYLYGDLISQRRDGESSFYCFDGLGSTLALTNVSGVVTDTNAYTAFGEVTEQTGNTVNPFQYLGKRGLYWDEETGEYVARRQFYLPSTARMLSPLIGQGATVSRYAVATYSPLSILLAVFAIPANEDVAIEASLVNKKEDLNCGNYQLLWKFGVTGKNGYNPKGFLILFVVKCVYAQDCDNKPINYFEGITDAKGEPCPNIVKLDDAYCMWLYELWTVEGAKVQPSREGYNDEWRLTWGGADKGKGTTGAIEVRSVARYFVGDRIPTEFGKPCGITSELPSTLVPPNDWHPPLTAVGNGFFSYAFITWDCCDPCKRPIESPTKYGDVQTITVGGEIISGGGRDPFGFTPKQKDMGLGQKLKKFYEELKKKVTMPKEPCGCNETGPLEILRAQR